MLLDLLVLLNLGVNVDGWRIIDVGCHTGVGEGLQRLLEMIACGVETSNHKAVGVTANRLLQ